MILSRRKPFFLFNCSQELIDSVCVLPLNVQVLTAHMTVGSNGKICGVSQIKLTDNRLRTGVKNLPDRFAELLIADLACAEGIYHYRNGLCNADCVSELNLTFIGKLCRDNILRDVTAVISRAAVNLCRVLTAERTAAVTRKSSVGIDDNFSACKTCVTDGTADYKSTCRTARE